MGYAAAASDPALPLIMGCREPHSPGPRIRTALMELKTREELRHAVAGLTSGNHEALDRLVRTAVFGEPELREAARAALLDQARSAGGYPGSLHPLHPARGKGAVP